MSAFHITRLRATDQALLAQYDDTPTPPPPPDGLCCDAFRRRVIAASLADPRCCMRCWPARRTAQLAARYAWKAAPFGRIRRVPPAEAARWKELSDG